MVDRDEAPQILPKRSLVVRVGLLMAAITLLAVLTMIGSAVIAHTARGDAAAINASGTLRMQAYRMATLMRAPEQAAWPELRARMKEFEATLYGDAVTGAIPGADFNAVHQRYARVRRVWDEEMRPAIETYQSNPRAATTEYLEAVAAFVTQVDELVNALQRQAEDKVQLLRVVQGAALFLTLGLVFFAMYKLLIDVMPPFRDLMRVVDEARKGNFNARTSYRGSDEIGTVSRTFNAMAANISRNYAELERRVKSKTAALEESNQSLQLLYDVSRRLNATHGDTGDQFQAVLSEVERALGLGPITLCLSNPDSATAYNRLTTLANDVPNFCDAPHCAACLGESPPARTRHVSKTLVSVPVTDGERRYGALLVPHAPGHAPSQRQLRLCEAVAEHVATAITLSRQSEQQRRLALMDERAVIARELHDSLAQALSYLKIQVSRLQAEYRKGAPDVAAMQGVTEELREGLNDAYRQLRELLNTFRLTMTDAGLHKALQRTAGELSEQSRLPIRLDFGLDHVPLTPNEEVHLLQTVREALINVVRHADASHARVSLQQDEDGRVIAEVVDDGVGIPENWERVNHYGIKIMEERVAGLGGNLEIERPVSGGTCIRFTFRPAQSGTIIASQAH
ncbi:type IV pili methyl-accepting chemotaxis transducer N-terminal domain-containing protein [Ectothiorhodospiraceae bacterium WFHF3C12]|nr:type IV pili methyl-accepting chemotaxis transducer N-terminal domain-containing protein [Ectothiorhodospiraceae bacterium WFHF3C12]